MSTLDEREQLIQQRQAEKYVNVIRMTVLVFLTVALVLRGVGFVGSGLLLKTLPPLILVAAWLYALAVQWAVSRGFFPRYLPWVTTAADLVFITIGFALELELTGPTYIALSTNLNWGYALLFLLILFSTLRERPELTLFNGGASTLLYATFLILYFPVEPFAGFWGDQFFRMAFLLLAGFFSSFHARSIRKAFQRAATSDRLRRETDSRLKVLALHFPGVLFQAEMVGTTFRLRYVSDGSRELLGVEPRDLVADPKLFFSKAPPELNQTLLNRLVQDRGTPRSWEEEFPFEAPGGRSAWFKITITTHTTPQGALVISGLVSDTTEQRRTAEALMEANQAKTDFLATMSHELRTPLNAILGNADHLSRLADQDDDRKAFRDLQASGETLLGLIEDILVFSRLEAGRLTAEVRPFAWRSQLEALVDTFRPTALAKGLKFVARWAPGPAWMWSDLLRLRQIVANLLANAVKFTPSGSVEVAAALGPEKAADGRLWFQLSVSDTGIGVPKDSQERIFEKFTQGEHGKSRTYGGLGLGLSISRSLAELLGGTLGFHSRSGGSTFTLRIPVRASDILEGVAAPGSITEPGSPTRILLVEDNLTNQDVATRMLQRLGSQVDLAPGGREAVEMASRRFYDLIFMDWQMPVMDGREATAKIRALPGGQDLVIVALSGHALPGDRELLLASGFDDYLSKPVRMDDFRAVLAKWVKSPRDPG